MNFLIRIQEYKIFFYRMFLAFLFYQIARVLFYFYNQDLIVVDSFSDFLNICYRGLAFDTTSILYINSLFIVFSLLPLFINTSKAYQTMLIWVYFATNLIAYATNFADFIYYKFTFSRTTTAGLESVENETNKSGLLWSFMVDYWHVFLLFFVCAFIWVKLYKRFPVKPKQYNKIINYAISSLIVFLVVATLVIGGIRGDFKHSTRPINLVDANRHVEKIEHSDLVLNTPFAIIRTINKNYFKKRNAIPQKVVDSLLQPIKKYNRQVDKKPNIIVLIVESYGREYIGSFNKNSGIKNYESFTPFLDSLSNHSLIFPNSFANGRKSIHAMSSVLAGVPSFKVAYTSSPYANQKTQSLVSVLNEMDYDTSFFHGAPNGSMGFLGYGNILGFDNYYGKTEYNNNDDFDGLWGIWDKPFFKYTNKELAKKQQPFMATIFTVSSHAPYIVPEEEEGKYPKGYVPMHQCVGYTDNALRDFFNTAKKEPWYNNSIFILTGDHTNQAHYDDYKKLMNRFAVPILIYSPNSNLVGENNNIAQQIDMYPTIVDLVGYNKPFRSWGRSLVGDTISKPYAITYNGSSFQFQQDSLIYNMDDSQTIGFYNINDMGLENNLENLSEKEKEAIELKAKSFVQDYMNRIIDKELTLEK